MSDEFFQWRIEKRRLKEIILEFGVDEGIDFWFQESVFQVSQEHVTTEYYLSHMRDRSGYENWQKEAMASALGIQILRTQGMYIEQIERRDSLDQIRKFTVFVLGRPQFIRDNKTQKLDYVRNPE